MSDWLIDTLLWTSALMILVLLVRGPVAERFGARVAYLLWALPVARFMVPTLTTVVERPALPADSTAASALAEAAAASALHAGSAAATPRPPVQTGADWEVLLFTVWALGAILTFAIIQARYHRDRAAILAPATTIERVRGIELMVSPAAPGPMAFGVLRRVIAMPQEYADRCSDSELDLALEHELSHHRSGDLVARLVGAIVVSLHWFNPIAWRAYAAFHFDQEAACDARVLARRGAEARCDYAHAIAKSASPRRMLFAHARDTSLKRRLKMMKNVSHRPLGAILLVGVAAVLLPATASRAISVIDVASDDAAGAEAQVSALHAGPEEPAARQMEEAMVEDSDFDFEFHHDDQDRGEGRTIHIDDDTPYSEMSAEERAEFDAAIEEMREALVELEVERVEVRREMQEELAEARREARIDKAEMRRELAEAEREIDRAIAEVVAAVEAVREREPAAV